MIYGRALALCALAAMAACGDGGSPGANTASNVRAAAAVKSGPSPQEQTAGMVQAASLGKSGVPVEIKFDLLARPMLGQMLDIDIAVLPQIPASAATIQLTSIDGLDLAAGGVNEFAFLAVEPDQVYHHKVSVKPTAEGVLFLGLTVTLTHDELVESRTFSIPIIVESKREVSANLTP